MKYLEVQGVPIPALGLGTYKIKGNACRDAVAHALDVGYRHVDTAQAYDNEQSVGRGLAASDVDRAEIFLTTKIWWDNLAYEDAVMSTEASLRRLDTDYIDLLLIHWPNENLPLDEPLAAMSKLQEQGKIRHVGVSNFTPSLLEAAMTKAPILCNQVEYHPFLSQHKLLPLAQEKGFALTAYSPLAQGKAVKNRTLKAIGERHGKTASQVALRWHMQQNNVAAIPRAKNPKHREQNLDIFDFELGEGDMEAIFGLAQGDRIIDPEHAPQWER